MNPKDMSPVLPFSLWFYDDYGLILVIDSAVGSTDDIWEISFRNRDGDSQTIEVPFMDWIQKATFRGEMPYIGI